MGKVVHPAKALGPGLDVDGMGCEAPRTRRCEREGFPKHPMDVSRKATTACLMVACGKGGSIPQAAMPPYRESEDLPPTFGRENAAFPAGKVRFLVRIFPCAEFRVC